MPASLRSTRVLWGIVGVTCLVPAVQACGSRSDTEDYLYGSDGMVTVAGASSSAGRGGAATGGRGPGISGSSSVGGTGSAVAGTNALGGSIGVAGGVSVGGTTSQGGVATGGSGVAGVAGATSGPPITCGAEVCDADVQSCCLSGGFHCVAKGQACDGAVLGCTTRADCGGEMCCLSITGDVADASSCKPSCDTGGNGRDRPLCDVAADCAPPFRYCTPTVFGVNICTRRP